MTAPQATGRDSEVPDETHGIAERLSRMVRVETVSTGVPERDSAPLQAFLALIEELYPLVHQRLEREPVTDRGVLYHWPTTADDDQLGGATPGGPVVLMAHFDVVPAFESEGWTHPPFDGAVADGSVWGRGTLDDKGALCVILEAVESLLGEGFAPARDVYLWFGGDEETGSEAATAAAALFRERGLTPWLVLDEGGAVVDAPLPFIDVPAAMIGVGEKGSVNVVLEASGDAGHASAPSGLTPTARIARAVTRVERSPFPARLTPAAREMFATFIPHARGRGRVILESFTRAPLLAAQSLARLGGDAAALVRTTLATTRLNGGTADNVLPASASATLNCRIAPGESVASTLRHVRRAVRDRQVRIRCTDPNEPTALAPTDNRQFGLLRDAARLAYPEAVAAPYITLAATDAKHFQRFAPATYRFAPLAMDARQRASIHGVDERVSIASLRAGKLFHEALLRSL
ncbi:M20/M25/M40 family metallo-hydrolase [Pseudoclavibacter terrae]|uniref:M20/M25/M40 family metallo-hydrolase n=1 Tax=Pseudoclavibacter terrae TaxID=1530195 RepID=UPI00232E921E|nr:M20/M25/M40 family metallo-hydrolase [Pseudoclavibacter terrae]